MRGMQAKAQDKKETVMFMRLACVIAVAAAIAGCETGADPYGRPSPGQAAASARSNEPQPDWMKARGYAAGGPVPPMEADRKINEQPCTEGIALTAGNLKCQ